MLVLQEYWVLKESRILVKPVLGGVRIVAPFVLMNRLNKTESTEVLSISEASVFPDYLAIFFFISPQRHLLCCSLEL